MTCADHQGAAQNMVGASDMVLAASGSGGAAGPDGPRRERDCRGMVEQVNWRRQAKAAPAPDAPEEPVAIYELLFKEGVMVAKKDVHMPKHPELADKNVPNLHVMKAMQSLKSRGYVKEQFAWRHFYWYLTNEGIQYLRDYLHLPPEIVPATLRRSRPPETGHPKIWRGSDL
ncbi:small ribosomal subunit protein eS10-like [Myotis yumanensis]|uniref:small ribosomal subunit protein eS10-like n=1 Tax=Myotis yumanensis TaxID=159337 RepID=UPI0038CF5087